MTMLKCGSGLKVSVAANRQIEPPPQWTRRSHAIWKWLRDAGLYCYWGLERSFVARCALKLAGNVWGKHIYEQKV